MAQWRVLCLAKCVTLLLQAGVHNCGALRPMDLLEGFEWRESPFFAFFSYKKPVKLSSLILEGMGCFV
jgi:hypothetical protein